MEDIQINKKEKILFNYYKELEPVSPVATNPIQGKILMGMQFMTTNEAMVRRVPRPNDGLI